MSDTGFSVGFWEKSYEIWKKISKHPQMGEKIQICIKKGYIVKIITCVHSFLLLSYTPHSSKVDIGI